MRTDNLQHSQSEIIERTDIIEQHQSQITTRTHNLEESKSEVVIKMQELQMIDAFLESFNETKLGIKLEN